MCAVSTRAGVCIIGAEWPSTQHAYTAVLHLTDVGGSFPETWCVAKVKLLVDECSIDFGRCQCRIHLVQGLLGQLGNAHVLAAINLQTAQTNGRSRQGRPVHLCCNTPPAKWLYRQDLLSTSHRPALREPVHINAASDHTAVPHLADHKQGVRDVLHTLRPGRLHKGVEGVDIIEFGEQGSELVLHRQ